MNEKIQNVISQMSAVAEDAKASFGHLSVEQLNWKPSDTGWSVAQCLDHIMKSNHEFDGEFGKLASGTRKNSFWESYSPFTGWAGGFLVKTLATDSKKVKAPTQRIVPPSDLPGDIVDKFAADVEVINQKVAACDKVDLQKTVLTSPFLAVMTYKADDALSVLVEHTKRHIRQAKRVMENTSFPR